MPGSLVQEVVPGARHGAGRGPDRNPGRNGGRNGGRNERSRRTGVLRLTVLLATVVLGAGACADGGAPGKVVASVASSTPAAPNGTASTVASAKGDVVAYAKCMRANGLPDFPDPKPGGGLAFRKGGAIDPGSPRFKKVEEKCKQFKGTGPKIGPGPGNPEAAWSAADKLKYARCMRGNGVPKFPDPGADGSLGPFIKGGPVDPESPQFKQGQAACKQYQPQNLGSAAPRQGGPGGGP